MTRGCSITLRWVPAHKGVEGNEVADDFAKTVAGLCDSVDRKLLKQASLLHLTRAMSEARTRVRGPGSPATSEPAGVTDPRGVRAAARSYEKKERSRPWQGVSTSSCLSTPRSAHNLPGKRTRSGPASTGGVEVAGDSHAITFLPGAASGPPISRSCEERREGLRAETSAGSLSQASFLGRAFMQTRRP